MKRNSLQWALLLAFLAMGNAAFCVNANASTNVNSMIITSDTTWTKANSPYMLTGNVLINNGTTLTVEAGTTLNLNGYYIIDNGSLIVQQGVTINMQDAAYIEVNGVLSAIGTQENPIKINGYTKLSNAMSLYYSSISFSKESTGWNQQTSSGSVIENTIINMTSVGISNSMKLTNNTLIGNGFGVSAGSPIISGNIVKGGGTINGGSPVISNNTVQSIMVGNLDSQLSGTERHETAIVSDNVISGGVFKGPRVTLTGYSLGCNLIFERNLIDGGNSDAGIELYMYSNVNCTAYILNNTIINNVIGIHFVTGYPQSISNSNIYKNTLNLKLEENTPIDCTNNWWGTTNQQAINQSIYDYKNDFNLGTVNFVPFLTESNPQAMPNPNAPLPTPDTTPSSSPTSPSQNSTGTEPTDQTGSTVLSELEIQEIVIATLIVIVIVLFLVIVWMQRRSQAQKENNPKQPTTSST